MTFDVDKSEWSVAVDRGDVEWTWSALQDAYAERDDLAGKLLALNDKEGGVIEKMHLFLAGFTEKNTDSLCVYCGERWCVGSGDAIDLSRAHMLVCPRHPMRNAECERDEMRERAERAEADLASALQRARSAERELEFFYVLRGLVERGLDRLEVAMLAGMVGHPPWTETEKKDAIAIVISESSPGSR